MICCNIGLLLPIALPCQGSLALKDIIIAFLINWCCTWRQLQTNLAAMVRPSSNPHNWTRTVELKSSKNPLHQHLCDRSLRSESPTPSPSPSLHCVRAVKAAGGGLTLYSNVMISIKIIIIVKKMKIMTLILDNILLKQDSWLPMNEWSILSKQHVIIFIKWTGALRVISSSLWHNVMRTNAIWSLNKSNFILQYILIISLWII